MKSIDTGQILGYRIRRNVDSNETVLVERQNYGHMAGYPMLYHLIIQHTKELCWLGLSNKLKFFFKCFKFSFLVSWKNLCKICSKITRWRRLFVHWKSRWVNFWHFLKFPLSPTWVGKNFFYTLLPSPMRWWGTILKILKIFSCFSEVGRTSGVQVLSLDNGCMEYPTIIHEMMQ